MTPKAKGIQLARDLQQPPSQQDAGAYPFEHLEHQQKDPPWNERNQTDH